MTRNIGDSKLKLRYGRVTFWNYQSYDRKHCKEISLDHKFKSHFGNMILDHRNIYGMHIYLLFSFCLYSPGISNMSFKVMKNQSMISEWLQNTCIFNIPPAPQIGKHAGEWHSKSLSVLANKENSILQPSGCINKDINNEDCQSL